MLGVGVFNTLLTGKAVTATHVQNHNVRMETMPMFLKVVQGLE